MDNNEMNPPATNLPINFEIDEKTTMNDESIWRDIDIFLPVDDIAQIEKIQTLFRVTKISTQKNYIYWKCNHKMEGGQQCKYSIRWRKIDGMVQSRGKHGHKKFAELKWIKCRECNFGCITNAVMSNHYLQSHLTMVHSPFSFLYAKLTDKSFRYCPKNANELHCHIQMHAKKANGDLAELQGRFDGIIQEWETQQGINHQQQMASTSNSMIGSLLNDQRQYAVYNLFHPQPSSIPSTSEMPSLTPFFLETTNWPRGNGKLEQNNVDEEKNGGRYHL